jgi:phosphatidylglycerol:prolipoprotein diacylglycerol transferase
MDQFFYLWDNGLGFNIGPVAIHFYGVILMLGALIGAFLAEFIAKRRGLNPDIVWDGFLWILIGGVIGARIWHIFTPSASSVAQGIDTIYYLKHPIDAINLTKGGLGWPGAIMGGALALLAYVRRNRISFGTWADIAAPALALGQAIGRLGNLVNHEVYGMPSNLPWAITIPSGWRLPEYADVERYHPLFLYESLLNIVNLVILLVLGGKYKDRLKPGDLILVYFINYGLIRFFLEFLRIDPSPVAGLNINQALAAVAVVASTGFLLWRHGFARRWQKPVEAVAAAASPAVGGFAAADAVLEPAPVKPAPKKRAPATGGKKTVRKKKK